MKDFNGYYCDEEMSVNVYNWIRALEKENNIYKEQCEQMSKILDWYYQHGLLTGQSHLGEKARWGILNYEQAIKCLPGGLDKESEK